MLSPLKRIMFGWALAGLVAAAHDNLKIIEAMPAAVRSGYGCAAPAYWLPISLQYCTSLLTDWLAHANAFESMTLMFQR